MLNLIFNSQLTNAKTTYKIDRSRSKETLYETINKVLSSKRFIFTLRSVGS